MGEGDHKPTGVRHAVLLMQTAGTSPNVKNLNSVQNIYVKTTPRALCERTVQRPVRGAWKSLQGSGTPVNRQYPNLGRYFIHLYSIIASSEAKRHASSKTAFCMDTAEAQPGAPPMEWCWDPMVKLGNLCSAWHTLCLGRKQHPYLCSKYFSHFPNRTSNNQRMHFPLRYNEVN